ncbi:monooxygenase [Erwinia pyrifoliae]|nr:monooxygenase [Erwinia pyrifoliae]MCT2386120.1 monooxygenase [Erwinia pyrifoliae]UWS29962.1 monooxygenase [Erwinia pyrifoliae]
MYCLKKMPLQGGGGWNPWSGGAYRNARMQNSRYAFHYTDFPPGSTDVFPGVDQVFKYLSALAGTDDIRETTRLNTEVISLRKTSENWLIGSVCKGRLREDVFDRAIIATGELWQPSLPALSGAEHFCGTLISSREYQEPEKFKGKTLSVIYLEKVILLTLNTGRHLRQIPRNPFPRTCRIRKYISDKMAVKALFS